MLQKREFGEWVGNQGQVSEAEREVRMEGSAVMEGEKKKGKENMGWDGRERERERALHDNLFIRKDLDQEFFSLHSDLPPSIPPPPSTPNIPLCLGFFVFSFSPSPFCHYRISTQQFQKAGLESKRKREREREGLQASTM